MKYGSLFSLLAILLAVYAVTAGRWFLLLLWPAASFGVIGAAYFGLGHGVFGKRPDGSMSLASIAILLPYLLYLWGVWHVIRILSREPCYNTLSAGVVIGRRLLSRELPRDIDTVVDLTCEFPEPAQASRPLVGLNRVQRTALHDTAAILQATG